MIVVDTSVWVAALRFDGPEAATLRALLDADEILLPIPVRVELLSGSSKRDRAKLRAGLSALPLAYPTDETWRLMDGWTERATTAGVAFGVGDLLIAALAHDAGALVWSLDGAFERLERLLLINRYDPAAPQDPAGFESRPRSRRGSWPAGRSRAATSGG